MKRTVGASPDSVGVIRWLSAILIGALALALVTTASIHVRESIATSMIQCDGAATADTHSDQSPDDSDKAARHHHGGCHGQTPALLSRNPPPQTAGRPPRPVRESSHQHQLGVGSCWQNSCRTSRDKCRSTIRPRRSSSEATSRLTSILAGELPACRCLLGELS
jgi:hypothetical protein